MTKHWTHHAVQNMSDQASKSCIDEALRFIDDGPEHICDAYCEDGAIRLRYRCTTNGVALRATVEIYGDGEPLVEADFEGAGASSLLRRLL